MLRTPALIGLEHVRRDPDGVRRQLLDEVWGLTECSLRCADGKSVVYYVRLEPWVLLRQQHYPTESAGILVLANGSIYATPHDGSGRAWRHRFGWDASPFRELCLADPTDPVGLRWTWDDGLVSFVTIVHRHLQAEEFARRHGVWPSEDAPHGMGPHPIRTEVMRRAAERWKR